MGVNFYLMKPTFFTHRIKLQIKFLPQPEFLSAGKIFTLRAPIFTMITKVWQSENQAVVTNNLRVIIDVVPINVVSIEGFLYKIVGKSIMNFN